MNGSFTVFKAWRLLRHTRPTSTSMHLCWFKYRIPRHAFILWLAIKGRLRTMDRLHDQERPRICTLCSLEDETHEHLFFNCRFSHEVWVWITTKHKTPWPNYRWPDLIQWGAVTHKSKSLFSSLVARLTLAASVYSIWMERS